MKRKQEQSRVEQCSECRTVSSRRLFHQSKFLLPACCTSAFGSSAWSIGPNDLHNKRYEGHGREWSRDQTLLVHPSSTASPWHTWFWCFSAKLVILFIVHLHRYSFHMRLQPASFHPVRFWHINCSGSSGSPWSLQTVYDVHPFRTKIWMLAIVFAVLPYYSILHIPHYPTLSTLLVKISCHVAFSPQRLDHWWQEVWAHWETPGLELQEEFVATQRQEDDSCVDSRSPVVLTINVKGMVNSDQ